MRAKSLTFTRRISDFFDPYHQQIHKALHDQHQYGGINIELLPSPKRFWE